MKIVGANAVKDSLIEEPGDKQSRKLVDWKNPPSLKDLKKDYEGSVESTDKHVKRVNEWIDCYHAEGIFKAPEIKGRSRVSPRLVRKQVEWRCPSLSEPFLAQPNLIEVEPRSFEDIRAAKQNALILNYQFKNKLNLVKMMDNIVRTMGVEGTVIAKTSWKRDTRVEKIQEETYQPSLQNANDPALVQKYQEIQQKISEDPSYKTILDQATLTGFETFVETGYAYEYFVSEVVEVEKERVIANHPYVEFCDIEDVFVDPTCNGDLEQAKFVVHRFDTCLSDLKKDGRYENLDEVTKHVQSTQQSTRNTEKTGFQFEDVARKNLEAFEYWGYYDIDGDDILYPMVATWIGDTLIRLERNPFPDSRLPFVFIALLPIKKSLYGEPDAELLKENQLILGATFRGIVDLLGRSSNGQTGFARGFLDSTQARKFNDGENYSYNPNMDPSRGIYTHKFPEIPQTTFQLINHVTADAESFSGVKPFSTSTGGQNSLNKGVDQRGPMDATAIRDSSILRRIAQGIVDISYRFQAMNSEFLTEQDVYRLTNKEFVRVDKDNLSGDFDLSIDIATAEADMTKAQDLAFMMQTGQQAMPMPMQQKLWARWAKIKKMPDLEEYLENYTPEPDPMQEKLRELEMAKLDAEIAVLQAQAAESRAKAYVHMAEVDVRGARVENIQSNTDKTNISTYRTANGIDTQERIDEMREQANNSLYVADSKHERDLQAQRELHNQKLLQEGAKNDLEVKSQGMAPTNNS